MKKLLSLGLGFLTLFIAVVSPVFGETQYTLRDMDTVALFDSADFVDINDKGQALLRCHINGDGDYWAIWDPSFGLITVDHTDPTIKRFGFTKITNSGQLLGVDGRNINGQIVRSLVIWDAIFGFKEFDLSSVDNTPGTSLTFPVGHSTGMVVATLCTRNESPSVKDQIFIWERGKIHPFNIEKDLEQLGYEHSSAKAIAVNEHGHILGSFVHWEKHPNKDKYIVSAPVYFVWNGSLSIIETPEEADNILARDINNNDEVLLLGHSQSAKIPLQTGRKASQSMGIWTKDQGITWSNTAYLDSNAKLSDEGDVFAEGSLVTLKRDNYKIEYHAQRAYELCSCDGYPRILFKKFAGMNRPGQIVIMAEFFNEQHPFLLEPTNID